MKRLNYYLSTFLMLLAFSSSSYAVGKGDDAISLPLQLLENNQAGRKAEINDYRGKLIYLDFWASWCGPCRESLPILNEIRSQYSSQGFEVIAVNVDEKLADARSFLKKYPVSYPVLLDPKGSMPKAYKLPGMPTAYLIDEKGKVIYKHVGFKSKDRKKIEQLISDHLANR